MVVRFRGSYVIFVVQARRLRLQNCKGLAPRRPEMAVRPSGKFDATVGSVPRYLIFTVAAQQSNAENLALKDFDWKA